MIDGEAMPKIHDFTYSEILNLVEQGLDNKEIANKLGIGVTSVPPLLKRQGIDRNRVFNRNRDKPNYFSSKNKVEVNPKDSEFFEIYQETSIDDILFK